MSISKHCVKSVQIWSFFWPVFSRIHTEYGFLLLKSPYSARVRENTDQKKLLGHFSHCADEHLHSFLANIPILYPLKTSENPLARNGLNTLSSGNVFPMLRFSVSSEINREFFYFLMFSMLHLGNMR